MDATGDYDNHRGGYQIDKGREIHMHRFRPSEPCPAADPYNCYKHYCDYNENPTPVVTCPTAKECQPHKSSCCDLKIRPNNKAEVSRLKDTFVDHRLFLSIQSSMTLSAISFRIYLPRLFPSRIKPHE